MIRDEGYFFGKVALGNSPEKLYLFAQFYI